MNDVTSEPPPPLLAGLSALAVAPSLAACGAGRRATSGTDEPAPPRLRGAFPVTIEHKYGATTEKAPARVVCVGLTEQDALLALGVVPVAVTKWFGYAPGEIFPWARRARRRRVPEVLEDENGSRSRRSLRSSPT